ncbi:hypothetical protein [Streptomyces sp. NPDC048196]
MKNSSRTRGSAVASSNQASTASRPAAVIR